MAGAARLSTARDNMTKSRTAPFPRLLALLLLMPPAVALAQFTYSTNNGTLTITGYTGSGGSVNIPSTTNNQSIVSIGDFAFYLANLSSVAIPSSVTNIGTSAFGYCSNLTAISVDASNSFYSGLAGVLFDRSQTELIQFPGGKAGDYPIPNSVTSIADSAFEAGNNLTGVTMPNSVTNMGNSSFKGCFNLTRVTISNGVPSIGSSSFLNCST